MPILSKIEGYLSNHFQRDHSKMSEKRSDWLLSGSKDYSNQTARYSEHSLSRDPDPGSRAHFDCQMDFDLQSGSKLGPLV